MEQEQKTISPKLEPETGFSLHEHDQNTMKKKSRKKLIIIASVLILLVITGLFIFFITHEKASAPDVNITNSITSDSPIDSTTIEMFATGDWIAHDAINAEAETNGVYDYSAMVQDMLPYLKANDINFCNQATLAGGEEFGITGYPIFNAPLEWIGGMKGLGCNVINTGTNHTNDKGQAPITAQLDEWDKQNVLAVAGSNRNSEEQNKVRYFEVKGVKFAFVSYSTYSNAPNPNPYSLNRFAPELYEPQIKEATEQADIVIASMRWGTEYSSGINAAQESAAQTLANLGVDIVLGHGPHVLEPVKRLTGQSGNETIVWYSLGNFLNAQLETETLTGCVATFSFDIASKKLTDSTCFPVYQHYEWSAEDKAAERLLSRSNFRIMPLYKADEWLAKSQLTTTVQEQMDRIQNIVNTYTKVSVQDSDGL